ncbi:PfkB family carbohydrate kinase [Arenibaculum pallidiluteum]|uniref:PfkB family carbohydrate kinase n=1 Tax=Arenibaculum pallidiluteum TaxID=2812559 RepID=UPI001A968DBB|nr:PfkB family carbohydrate kinase [Arenibaculum pallidiluteum]
MSHRAAHFALLVNALASARVLVIGDAPLEREVTGAPAGLAPEAPVPLLNRVSSQAHPGGAAAILCALEALRVECALATVTGTDAAGRELLAALGARGIDTDGVVQHERYATPVRERVLSGSQTLLRIDHGGGEVPSAAAERLIAWVARVIVHFDAVVIADRGLGVLGRDVLARLMVIATAAERPVIAEPHGAELGLYSPCRVLRTSPAALRRASGLAIETEADLTAAARLVMTGHAVQAVMVAHGDGGTLYVPREGEPVRIAPDPDALFDATGAGESASAAMAAALAIGADASDAAVIAGAAAACAGGRRGMAAASAEDILGMLRRAGRIEDGAKLVAAGALRPLAEGCRAAGRRIGFMEGGFDLLDADQVDRIQRARAACDFLVVGVEADAAQRRRRGAMRPVQPQEVRAATLAALDLVDRVLLLDEEGSAEAIWTLRPDVLVEGEEPALPAGREFVRSYGGQVVASGSARRIALAARKAS